LRPFLVSPLTVPQMQERAQQLLNDIAKDIHDSQRSVADDEALSKLAIVAKIIRYMNRNEIEEVLQQASQKYVSGLRSHKYLALIVSMN
jgi:hypothetical protein